MDTLIFNHFADKWEAGMPVGNGRLAAMLWGTADCDILSLNHECLWTGDFKERVCDESAHFLPYVRDYLKRGENFKATALAAVAFGGNGGISPLTRRMDSYQPAGELVFRHAQATAVSRKLDLRGGVADSEKSFQTQSHAGDKAGIAAADAKFPQPESAVRLSVLCHATRDVFAFSWQSETAFSGTFAYERELRGGEKTLLCIAPQRIRYDYNDGNGVAFAVALQIETDGVATVQGDTLCVKNATHITVLGNIGTSVCGIEEELAAHPLADLFAACGEAGSCAEKVFAKLRAQQETAFARHMDAVTIELTGDETPEVEGLSIHERQARLRAGADDAQLVALYARYGMYLMVAGSVLAQLPLHLQGKWNREIYPKWNSDYHLNINLQMNYWFTDALGMDAFSRQMTDYVLRLLPKAREAARRTYGCGGVLYPLNSDLWCNATAESYNYSVWIGAAGWLAAHFWRSFEHTGDTAYLREYAYPFFKEVAQFYEDYIVTDENGTAQLMPSQSPENRYEGGGYFPVSMCISSAMDVQIAYDALDMAAKAAAILEADAEDAARWCKLRDSLPPFRIGKDGRLLEWDSDDKKEIEEGHRHVSHLYGVYPAALFTPERRTQQFAAARKSLDYRLAHSGGHTGWSSAWSACLFARFLDAEAFAGCMRHLIANQSSASLLDLHPDYYPAKRTKAQAKDEPLLFSEPERDPPMIFQIDGNLGGSAAVLEALVQTRDGEIHLLPAIPTAWKKGRLRGVRVPGGHVLTIEFENGKLTALTCRMGFAGQATFVLPDGTRKSCEGKTGEEIAI